jgi:bifunctional DNase/RNase
MIEVDIAMVKLETETKVPMAPIVILREKKGSPKRLLPIWVGLFEAIAIIMELEEQDVQRPMTHDLLKSVIDSLGAKVVSVLVSDLKDRTFYAQITLNVGNGEVIKVDSRPSDALALALRTDVPIYVSEQVMAGASISPEITRMGDDEELRDVLENLNPEDLYKV